MGKSPVGGVGDLTKVGGEDCCDGGSNDAMSIGPKHTGGKLFTHLRRLDHYHFVWLEIKTGRSTLQEIAW